MASFQWVKDPSPISEITPASTLPEELRPHLSHASTLSSIPTIDLGQAQPEELVEKVARACEEYGFFRIINHGVPDELCTRLLDAIQELFESPPHVKAELFTEDPRKEVRLFRYHLKMPGSSSQEKTFFWSEAFIHPWHPSHDFTALLPSNPPSYRSLMAEYAPEMSKLFTKLLSLISLGLGLDKDYLERRHGQSPRLRAQTNYYPPCPNPELALGLPPHSDFNTLTILQQSSHVIGLQVLKDGKWMNVDPVPRSFIVNVGDQLQVLSNGRYKSVKHRAVVNKHKLRVSMGMFYAPDEESMIGPVEELVSEERPQLYRSYRYKEFVQEYQRQTGTARRVKETFELQR